MFYLDDRLFQNLIHHIFILSDTDASGCISQEEFNKIMANENIEEPEAVRLWTLAQKGAEKHNLVWLDFANIAEIIYNEAMSHVVFSYLSQAPKQTEDIQIDFEIIIKGLHIIWRHFSQPYPFPQESSIEDLLKKYDMDHDGKLDLNEFFKFWSVFLRYYRTYADNYRYAKLIRKDHFISKIWKKEEEERQHKKWMEFWTSRVDQFFKYAIFEFPFMDLAHELFDAGDVNKDKHLDKDEFIKGVSKLELQKSEVDFLWHIGNTDENGQIDFAEFCFLLETLIHRSIAQSSWALLKENELTPPSLQTVQEFITNVTCNLNITIDTFTNLASDFQAEDQDGDGLLDYDEYAELISKVLSNLKLSLQAKAAGAYSINTKLKTKDIHKVARADQNLGFASEAQKDLGKAEIKDRKALKKE